MLFIVVGLVNFPSYVESCNMKAPYPPPPRPEGFVMTAMEKSNNWLRCLGQEYNHPLKI